MWDLSAPPGPGQYTLNPQARQAWRPCHTQDGAGSIAMNRLLAVAAAILLLGAGAPRALAQDFVLSISFDGGGWFDRSFNEGTWAGISEAVRELAVTTDFDILLYNGAPATTTQGVRTSRPPVRTFTSPQVSVRKRRSPKSRRSTPGRVSCSSTE